MTEIEKFYKMQSDCYYITNVLKGVQDMLNQKFTDGQAMRILCEGSFWFATALFVIATGRKPNSTEVEKGRFVQEPLTQDHMAELSKKGIEHAEVDAIMLALDKVSKIEYFDYFIHNGIAVINETELTNISKK